MDSRGSVRPTGQIESIETLSQKKKSKFERSETWVPCDNDEIVTKEILRQEAERELGSGLREFISSSFGDKETIDEIFQEVWVRLLKKVENEIIYLSGLRQYTGKLAYGLILNKRRERTRSKTREESLTDNHTNGEGSKGYRYELPQRIKADAETVVFLKEIFNFLNQRERAIFSLRVYGFDDDEIGEKLKIAANNVRQIRYRAFVKLSKWIKQGTFYEKTFGR